MCSIDSEPMPSSRKAFSLIKDICDWYSAILSSTVVEWRTRFEGWLVECTYLGVRLGVILYYSPYLIELYNIKQECARHKQILTIHLSSNLRLYSGHRYHSCINVLGFDFIFSRYTCASTLPNTLEAHKSLSCFNLTHNLPSIFFRIAFCFRFPRPSLE